MITWAQCVRNKRTPKKHVIDVQLKRMSAKRGTVLELRRDLAPKKPNSAKRQCVKLNCTLAEKYYVNPR